MCDPSGRIWIYATTVAQTGQILGDPKLDIHLISDPNHCVVSNMILNSFLVTVMAVGTVPRARAALEPHKHGFYCELLEHSRWHKTSGFGDIRIACSIQK